jgi:hypothetical protein
VRTASSANDRPAERVPLTRPGLSVSLAALIRGSVVLLALVFAAPAVAEPTTTPRLYDNCTNYNKTYPHGVGRPGAHDKTKSKSSEPVTTFKRSLALYKRAMKYNNDLDRDNDGIACEKH